MLASDLAARSDMQDVEPLDANSAGYTPNDNMVGRVNSHAQSVREFVSRSPLHNLWNFEGVPFSLVMKRTFRSFLEDDLLSRAAEMGYYFLFALFPTLITASAILGLAAKSATAIYLHLLDYLSLVIPASAFNLVVTTFNQTTAASTAGKVTFGLVAAVWSASVGFSAIQDGMNTVYRVKETRPFWKARGSAIAVTVLLSLLVTINLTVLLAGDYLARKAGLAIHRHQVGAAVSFALHSVSAVVAVATLMLSFSVIYYYAPNLKSKQWHWLTPGATLGIGAWLFASVGLRIYLHYFDSYSLTYGSLGAVIVLLTWFYLTGLMLLLGAEVNSQISAAVAEQKLKAHGALSDDATMDPASFGAHSQRDAV